MMKVRIPNLLLFCLLIPGCHPETAREISGPEYGVNTKCYDFRQEEETPAPAGFRPVYISHYGRHGSRTGMKVGDSYDKVLAVLEEACSNKLLTSEGDSLFNEARWVHAVHNGMDGRLTRIGEEEERILGEALYRRYPEVFRKGSHRVRVEFSTVPRSIVSGTCFIQALTALQTDLQFTFDTGEKFFEYINNTSSPEHTASVNARLDSINALTISDGTAFFSRIFKDPLRATELVCDPDEFQRLVWRMAREGEASGLKVDMFRHLPTDVVRKWQADDICNIYMRHGNSMEFGEERMKRTEPLVAVIFRQAQQALSCGNVAADLKFGHDYPLVAMAGYFGLEGVGDRLGWADLPDAWSDPMNIPFATNMQIVFYRNRCNDVLVKFVYNGKERRLKDLTAFSGPYYRWEDVYKHFIPEGDERTFALADWNWRTLDGGAEVGYAQLELFGSTQSISVLRYPMSGMRSFIANDPADSADSTSAIALRYGAVAAINGSYFDVKTLYPSTFVKDDGVQEGWTRASELRRVDGILTIKNHRKLTISNVDTTSNLSVSKRCREAIAAGPVLLKDGVEARPSWPGTSFYTWRHPRTFVGTTADGMVYLVVIDGRFENQGIGTTIHETTEIARMFGLCDALNLDGGGSSVLWTGKYGTISNPYDNRRFDHFGQRVVPNVLYIKK